MKTCWRVYYKFSYPVFEASAHCEHSKESVLYHIYHTIGAAGGSSGAGAEMPHFSLPSLTSKHVHNQHLNYVYYLEHGQPSFAFANFVAAKKRHGHNFNKE